MKAVLTFEDKVHYLNKFMPSATNEYETHNSLADWCLLGESKSAKPKSKLVAATEEVGIEISKQVFGRFFERTKYRESLVDAVSSDKEVTVEFTMANKPFSSSAFKKGLIIPDNVLKSMLVAEMFSVNHPTILYMFKDGKAVYLTLNIIRELISIAKTQTSAGYISNGGSKGLFIQRKCWITA